MHRYRSQLRDSLTEAPAAAAFDAWRRYVCNRHGDVFARLAADSDDRARTDVARALFVETLAFDYLLVEILYAAEREFGCTLTRALAADAAVPFVPDFEAVHESVSPHPVGGAPADESEFDAMAAAFAREASNRDVATLHRECVSPLARRAFGRYDTPPGVAALAVESIFEGAPADADCLTSPDDCRGELPNVLDPGCGGGAFLAAAAARFVESDCDGAPEARVRAVFDAVCGFDVSPTAVRASRLALVLAVRPLLDAVDDTLRFTPQVVLGDAVEATADHRPLNGQRADVLLANPPWLTWDSLPENAKARWRPEISDSSGDSDDPNNSDRSTSSDADELDLFGHTGVDARLGYANDDLSVPYAWTCLHRLLRDGGRAALVLKRDLLTGPAGERLRRPDVGERSITYDRVHDFGSLSPFPDVDAGTALLSLRISRDSGHEAGNDDSETGADDPAASPFPTADGIPTVRWAAPETSRAVSERGTETAPDTATAPAAGSPFTSLSAMRARLDRTETRLVPADPADPTSAWIRADAERRALGENPYRIRHGVKDDAKAVYAVDRELIERCDLESEHVFPYLKSKHIVKYGLFGHDLHLVPQRQAGADNAAELEREAPATYAYLEENRERLTDRGSSWFDDGPFYSLFGLGSYTWAPYKIVWCRLGFKPHFAVVSTVADPVVGEKPVVPGDHCMFVSTDSEAEAHYLCALLNSAPYQRCLRDISSGGKSSLSKSTVERLALPEWRSAADQRHLAELSQRAHAIVPNHVDCSKRAYNQKTIPELQAVQTEIDRTAERFLADIDARAADSSE
ncbi:type I restriction endonuclease subunit M [Halobellus sp. Atlit-31R]|nr:type I restriction endonuclease subunit M [Halobellus sp. Atlit-31R]